MDKIRWTLIAVFFLITLISSFDLGPTAYGSMALVTIFTMLFVTLMSFITISESKELR